MAEPKEKTLRRREAYMATFCGAGVTPHVEAERVLADLKKFCGMQRPGMVVSPKSGMVDSHATLYMAGMRDVYIHITGLLGIDERQLFQEFDNERAIQKTAE